MQTRIEKQNAATTTASKKTKKRRRIECVREEKIEQRIEKKYV